MTHAFITPAGPTLARRRAIAAAVAACIGLGASAAWLAGKSAGGPEPKLGARLDAGPVEKRELAFYPRERAADDSIRNFRPGKAWEVEAPAAPDAALASATPAKPSTPARAQLAIAPLPPVRPVTLAKAAPAELAPRYADLPADRRTASARGLSMPAFVPTGADVMKRIGGLGASMRDSIGSVGSSLGKLMRISSR